MNRKAVLKKKFLGAPGERTIRLDLGGIRKGNELRCKTGVPSLRINRKGGTLRVALAAAKMALPKGERLTLAKRELSTVRRRSKVRK